MWQWRGSGGTTGRIWATHRKGAESFASEAHRGRLGALGPDGELLEGQHGRWHSFPPVERTNGGQGVHLHILGGDRLARKSTGSYVLFDGARTQSVLAWSSGESETYGAAAGVSLGPSAHAMLEWLKNNPEPLSFYLDPKAAQAFTAPQKVRGVRHLEVQSLWMQSLANVGRLRIHKVPGEGNGAGLNSKVHPRLTFDNLCRLIGLRRWDVSSLKEQDVKHVEHERRFDSMQMLSLGLCAVAGGAATFAEVVLGE